MQVIAWCVYSYSAPPQPAPVEFLVCQQVFSHADLQLLGLSVILMRPTSSESLGMGLPLPSVAAACIKETKQNDCICFILLHPWSHASSPLCVHSVFVAGVKGRTVSQDFHMPLLYPVPPLPQLKVYLRLRFSNVEGLDVNIQSTSSLNTPIQREGKQSGSSSVENSTEHTRQYKRNSCETLEDHTMQKYANFLFCCLITSFSKRWLWCVVCEKLCDAYSVEDEITWYKCIFTLFFKAVMQPSLRSSAFLVHTLTSIEWLCPWIFFYHLVQTAPPLDMHTSSNVK